MNNKNKIKLLIEIVIPVFILIIIDQVIKIYISKNFMDKYFYIIDNILGFHPFINSQYSWLNSMGNFGISLITHIVINIVLIFLSITIFYLIKGIYRIGMIGNCLFVFLFSGAICSLIDKIFWGGSLDYILLEGFFIFDLKDVYITVFEIILVTCLIFNYKGLRTYKLNTFHSEVKTYIKTKYSKEGKGRISN